jgi:hypothetical protein
MEQIPRFSSKGRAFMRFLLAALLLFWAALLFGGFALGTGDDEPYRRIPGVACLASSVTLVVAGWTWSLFARGSAASTYAMLIAVGMTLGFLGDLLLAGLLPVPEPLMMGMGSFGLGHVAYITAIIRFGNRNDLCAAGPRWGAWFVWIAVGGAGWYYLVFRGHVLSMIHWGALPYSLLLASTAGFAAGLALQAFRFAPLALGGSLFVISDMLIAARLFNNTQFPMIGDVIWLTYGTAQMLIVYSVWAALRPACGRPLC